MLTSSNETNVTEENAMNLVEDEEELRRLENIENSYIPFTVSSQTNEKEKQQINYEQLEYMQRLLNNRTALLSDDVVKNIKDVWSLDKEQRQALYRYWLWKYIEMLIGRELRAHVFLGPSPGLNPRKFEF
jgi:hypothetical protein